ncbi:molybdopterin-binding protein [Methylobacterium oryzisoli]|uniref:molybdopterin-binding protein n=1 Tax=Methylobacterium oryzisoli TaxID=3385502 RepID=UPI0038918360
MTPRTASATLMPLADAVARLAPPPVPARRLPVAEAVGAVAASDCLAPHALPRGRTALRDGYAVLAADVVGASPYAPVPLPSAPDWVEAGAALPPGTDTVLPPEALDGDEAVADAPAGEGTRAAGAEAPAGRLLAAGERISPLHAAGLALAGITAVEARRPSLTLLVTGEPAPDALSPLVAALLAREGARVTATVSVPDDPAAIAAAITNAEADAVLVLGGTGFGRRDRSAEGLARAGSLAAHGIALRPGETAGFGEAGGRPVLLLPGRPDAMLAATLALGRPLAAALAGRRAESADVRAPLRRKLSSVIGLAEMVFLQRQDEGVMPLGGAEIPLHRLLRADGAVLVPPDVEGYAGGTMIEFLPL